MSKKNNARGFTLIELVVVVAVIAILAALLVPTILGQVERARISRARSDANEIAKALVRIRNDTGSQLGTCYDHTAVATLEAILRAPQAPAAGECGPVASLPNCGPQNIGQICWNGPYMQRVTVDPWGNPYQSAFQTGIIVVTSGGPTGIGNAADNIVVEQ